MGNFTARHPSWRAAGNLAYRSGTTIRSGRSASRCRYFTAALTQSKVRQARYNWDAAKAGLDFTSRQTEEQTRDAYQGVISQIAQVRALKQAVDSDRMPCRRPRPAIGGHQDRGRCADRACSAVQAETNYAQAKYGYLDNIVALRLAAGNLDRAHDRD